MSKTTVSSERNITLIMDYYEMTMSYNYFKLGRKDEIVYFDMFFRKNPDRGGFTIMAGLQQLIEAINDIHFTQGDIEYFKQCGLDDEEFFETWLTRILINECYNLLAARKTQLPLEEAPELPAADEGGNRALRDALLGLDEKLRLPVMLHYMEGYRVREIAGILGLPEGTVKTRLARAKRELKKYLEEEEA